MINRVKYKQNELQMSYSWEVSDGFPENVMWKNMETKRRPSDTENGQRKRWEMEKHTFCRTGGKNVKNRCRDVPEIAGNGGKTEL